MKILISLALLVSGCGLEIEDRCAGVKGSCLMLQVDPSDAVRQVDRVVVNISSPGPASHSSTVNDGHRLSLPIGIGVVFDSVPPTGTMVAKLDAYLATRAYSSAPVSFTLVSGEHRTLHVSLGAATTIDGGSGVYDGPASDLGPSDLGGSSDLSSVTDLCIPRTACPSNVGCGTISDGCGGTVACTGLCQLTAIEPSVANIGATVTLEGTFGADANVYFPGGVVQPATVLGAHRAQVIVPAAASTGDLTVKTGSDTLGPLTFHRAPYKLGLRPFSVNPEQTSGGQIHTNTSLVSGTAVVIGKYLYLIGGQAGRNYFVPIKAATINSDGTLTQFISHPDITLTTPRMSQSSTVIGRYIYVVGGIDASGAQIASVERASINADDTISAFTLVDGVALQAPRAEQASAVIGNYLYQIGGFSGGPLAGIERATINPDGSLSTFASVDELSLTIPRRGASTIILGDRLYVIGGANAQALNTVESAAINADGSLGPFATAAGVTLSSARSSHASFVCGDSVYVVGGKDVNGASLASVEKAAFTDDSLSPFVAADELAMIKPRTGAVFSVAGDHLIVVGGFAANGGWQGLIEQASLDDSGDVSNFELVNGVTLTTPRLGHTSFVAGNHFYVVAGTPDDFSSVRSDVEEATILPDGTITTFTPVPGINLVTPRAAHVGFSGDEGVYVVGGLGADGVSLASIERAVLNPDGTFASNFVEISGVTLATKVQGATGVGWNNNTVLIGGTTGTSSLSAIESGQFGSSSGSFVNLTGTGLVQGRSFYTTAVFGNTIYVLGGLAGGPADGYLNTIESANDGQDFVPQSLSAFSVVDETLIVPRALHSSFVLGRSLYVAGGRNTDVAGSLSSLERSDVANDATLGPFAVVASAFNTARLQHTSNVIKDYVYVVGGAQGYGATAFSTVERAKRQ